MKAPPRRVAGLGFRGAATAASLRSALDKALQVASCQCGEPVPLAALATACDKAAAPAFTELAAMLKLPVLAVALDRLQLQDAAASAAVPARYGRRSLAEAAALAGAGPGAQLLAARCVGDDGLATCAIAAIAENAGP
ncbi:hypothetical protein RD110_04610 [Rhodoferax koreense]|uniref:CobE/GbiG C-terminal domain-containing protein n=1 Tax=Rhodoferax koreensis TaxID=1842727 RepID=A0A1P8K3F5_9BURK|nr:cobalamin biosynthesis protein [Rhodoferax koreense]APW40471.1 hypothetical protein RD110_04610 [Rhodoferax koreense]